MRCEFCESIGGELLWQDRDCRVVRVRDEHYPAFCRVIWQRHVREMTDLAPPDRAWLMDIVFAVETTLRDLLHPDKVNLASLGNLTPHLHWHVVPRFINDPHFPNPIWTTRLRHVAVPVPADLSATIGKLLAVRLGKGRVE
jgi:diadenosine tetraphosphate (Ap4A) HIT family hydrolase